MEAWEWTFEFCHLWNRLSEDQSAFSLYSLKPSSIYTKIEKYCWRMQKVTTWFGSCIGVVRKNDFFLTSFYYRRLFLYWIWTHLCVLNELSARRCTSLLMVTAILMTACCYSCWSTCLRRHVFPFCMITQKNISIQYPVRGYSVTDAACLMSALLSQDFSVWILHSLLKVAALSHVLSRARLRDL